jgi:predicted PurR-regulated permease PerM
MRRLPAGGFHHVGHGPLDAADIAGLRRPLEDSAIDNDMLRLAGVREQRQQWARCRYPLSTCCWYDARAQHQQKRRGITMSASPLKSEALPEPASRARQLIPSTLLAWGVFGLLLYVAHAAFVPIALALLLALILSGPVEALHKYRVSRSLSAMFILVTVLAVMAGGVNLMWEPTQEWFAKAPQTVTIIKRKARPVAQFMNRLDDLRNNAGNLNSSGRAAPANSPTAVVAGESAPVMFLDATGEFLAAVLTFIIVTLFLLTGGPPMLARMTAAFADDLNASHVLDIIERVRAEVGRFYVATALINLGLGCATTAVMMAWGMPTPYLWGALAAVLNFIPYAGSATTLLVVTLVAAVSFDTLGRVLGVAGSYLMLSMIEGQVVQPLLVGRRLEVNPLLVFLALWFGGLFWGVAGIILATPALVALKVIAEHTKSGKSVVEFLGPNDQSPDRDKKLKQLAARLD